VTEELGWALIGNYRLDLGNKARTSGPERLGRVCAAAFNFLIGPDPAPAQRC